MATEPINHKNSQAPINIKNEIERPDIPVNSGANILGNKSKPINHVGIIMDGNRRFSKKLSLDPWKGHEYGAEKFKEVLKWCKEYSVKTLTLYTFSYENFNRPKVEFDFLMNLFIKELSLLIEKKDELAKDGLRIRFVGRLDMFPKEVHDKALEVMRVTEANNKHTVNLAVAYSGRIEIIDAIRRLIADKVPPEEINEEAIKKRLYIDADPEIIIRTGGEKRLSNFLTFQSVYTELFFVDKLWPEFSRLDFDQIISQFHERDRRFGK
jgi:tritrans,polycis-undecaprenyl-diphosphate synthase [geranylgeranyl-diphosphate specific]